MKFKVTQDCSYANGYLRYGHLEGIIEVESREELERLIKEEPEYIQDKMEFQLDDYELNDYDTEDNPIVIEGEVNEK